MMKHTPGPWILEDVKNDSGHIKHFVPVSKIDGQVISLLTTVEHNGCIFAACYEDADARLIAAAPDLLEALKEVNNWLVCGCIATPEDMAQSFQYMQELSNAAITKATGEQA